MAAVDVNIVAIAIPRISSDFLSGIALLGWVLTGYFLALAALTLQSGKIGDLYGRKRVYLVGFAVFGAASALCGLSQNIYQLIAFRILQGVSAAFLFSVARPLLFDFFPPSEVAFAVGVNSAAWSVGAVAGPAIGGFLVALDWRLIFYVNVPIAILSVVLTMNWIPADARVASDGVSLLKKVNVPSFLLLAVTVSMILLWLSFFTPTYAAVGLASLLALLAVERRSLHPLLNRELRKSRPFVSSMVVMYLFNTGFAGITFAMSLYYESTLGLSPEFAGILIVPISAALAAGSVLSGKLYARSARPIDLSIAGTVITGSGLVALWFAIDSGTPFLATSGILAVIGMGCGLYWTPTVTAAISFARLELSGEANGSLSTFIAIGGASSIALIVGISAAFLPSSMTSQLYTGSIAALTAAQAEFFKHGIADALLGLGVISLLCLPFLLLMRRSQRARGGPEPVAEAGA